MRRARVRIGERADSYGASGANISHEVKSALKDDPENATLCLSRIYGLGGRDFYADDAEAFFALAVAAAASGHVDTPFDYHGAVAGDPARTHRSTGPRPLRADETTGHVKVAVDPETGTLRVETPPLWKLAGCPKRVAPGHGACPGCGVFPSVNLFLKGVEGDVVVLYQTGCAMVVSTGYPFTSHRVSYVHNLFQNGAATLSGLVEMFHELSAAASCRPATTSRSSWSPATAAWTSEWVPRSEPRSGTTT